MMFMLQRLSLGFRRVSGGGRSEFSESAQQRRRLSVALVFGSGRNSGGDCPWSQPAQQRRRLSVGQRLSLGFRRRSGGGLRGILHAWDSVKQRWETPHQGAPPTATS